MMIINDSRWWQQTMMVIIAVNTMTDDWQRRQLPSLSVIVCRCCHLSSPSLALLCPSVVSCCGWTSVGCSLSVVHCPLSFICPSFGCWLLSFGVRCPLVCHPASPVVVRGGRFAPWCSHSTGPHHGTPQGWWTGTGWVTIAVPLLPTGERWCGHGH
jgi:hypothetical protein